MATFDPYENLALISDMQKKALEDLIAGRLVGEGMVPTASLTERILEIAPRLYEMYRGTIGEDWVKQYLPPAGTTITNPLRQALQAYEREMTRLRDINPNPLVNMYSMPAGIPTLNTRMQEAAHTAWQLGQLGQWYNPVTKTIEFTPMVRSAFVESAVPIYETAGGAPTVGAIDYNKLVKSLSSDNPHKKTIQDILSKGYVPTAGTITKALNWENEKASQKGEKKEEKPTAQEFRNALAGLAAQYDNPAEFQQHLLAHYAELVPIIGEDGFRDLYTNAAQWVGRMQPQPLLTRVTDKVDKALSNMFGRQRKKEPGIDAIGEFIQQMRSAGLWPVGVGGGGSK